MNDYDVVVVGGGNAGLTAAITCAENGAKTLLLESAPKIERGGNTKYTRDIRYAHSEDGFTAGEYSKKELLDDLRSVSDNSMDLKMASLVIEDSESIPVWMYAHGVMFKKEIRGTLSLSRTNAFFLGGGKALVNTYYRRAEKTRVNVTYEAEVQDLKFNGDRCESVIFTQKGERREVHAKSFIIASGGFESNQEKLRELWGPPADNFIIRGTRNNTGIPLQVMVEHGAETVGGAKTGHMIAVDARGPKFDGGIVTRIDAIPMGIVLNRKGMRFYDEGEDLWPKRYAIWGHLVSEQPDQMAYVIVDSRMLDDFLPTAYPPFSSPDIENLLLQVGLPVHASLSTIRTFNSSVVEGRFDRTKLDDCHTVGVEPAKSHWARRIEEPPFFAFPLRPGLTFTYMGLKVNEEGRVVKKDGEFENVFAAGEVMSGNVLTKGYLAGFGLTIGSVFGVRAGKSATSRR